MTPLPQVVDGGDEYPPLSALNDLLFCERRCYLHRVEGVWIENVHTLSGSHSHRNVHTIHSQSTHAGQVERGLRLISHTLRVQGVADLVEFMDGVPYPIEYKRGKRRKWDNDEVQLCAQAICLEEMLQVPAPRGAIYHVKSRHRREIAFTQELREQTYSAASRLHEVLRLRQSPPAILHPKCKQCSLHAICLPELLQAPAEYQNAAARLFELPRDEKG